MASVSGEEDHSSRSRHQRLREQLSEMFIQHLAEMGHNVVKSEKKPRRNIQYRDLSNAISRADNLEFLVDVVPRTMPYKDVKQKKLVKAPTSKANGDSVVAPGQTTLDKGRMTFANGAPTGATNGFGAHDGTDDEDAEDPNTQLQMDMRARKASYSGGQNNLLGMALNEDVDMS
ncbi:hypothetical protein B7494_g73 [Chlorociboria aeruginascens]|nr:hypothetical protein B7494_g73 [Chlorociboria aeruginascens]